MQKYIQAHVMDYWKTSVIGAFGINSAQRKALASLFLE
jgi:hypothetical protein